MLNTMTQKSGFGMLLFTHNRLIPVRKLYTVGGNVNGAATMRIGWRFLKKLKIELPRIHQFHSWAYIQRKP